MAKPKIKFEPPTLDLVLYAGDGPSFRILVKDPTGDPLPLTGTMKAEIRATRHAIDPPLAEFAIDETEMADGVVTLSLTGDETDDLVPTGETFNGVWDLQWTAAGSEPLTLCQGDVECVADVTH